MRWFVLGGLLLALAGCSESGGQAEAQQGFQGAPQQMGGPQGGGPPGPQGGLQQVSGGQAEQALQGLYGIRQQQCQMGNQLACQSLGEFPRHSQQLAQSGQACRSGNQQACGAYNSLSQRIMQSYAESAQVMQAGAQSEAQMNAWRAQMNANHEGNMARLNAQAAAGQATHQARQQSYAAQNQAWASQQAAAERNTGRFNDYIYEGTTVSGGGVQTFTPHGSTAYTDGQGHVVMGPEGGEPPAGYQQMTPTYAAPQ